MNYDYELKTAVSVARLSVEDNVVHLHATEGKVVPLPSYSGTYEITPSSETQILETANRTTTADIVVNPVPSNYGLITWNGSFLTVS